MASEYVFVDEWDVLAPPEVVYAVIADARTYPEWWKPVYISVEGGRNDSMHHFKGKLPYTLKMHAQMVREEPPRQFEVSVDGDLRGKGRARKGSSPMRAPARRVSVSLRGLSRGALPPRSRTSPGRSPSPARSPEPL